MCLLSKRPVSAFSIFYFVNFDTSADALFVVDLAQISCVNVFFYVDHHGMVQSCKCESWVVARPPHLFQTIPAFYSHKKIKCKGTLLVGGTRESNFIQTQTKLGTLHDLRRTRLTSCALFGLVTWGMR